MKLRNLLLNIPKLFLVLVFCSVNTKLLSEDMKNCAEDFPSVGKKLIATGENEFKIIITKKKKLTDALNNESLAEHIALLKLDVVEDYQKFLNSNVSKIKTKDGDNIYIENFDDSWETMKKSIASMKNIGTCIEKNRILLTGEWSTKSMKRVARIIELEKAFDDLLMLEMVDPKFDIDNLLNKYPRILDSEDPKFLRNVINNWKKNMAF